MVFMPVSLIYVECCYTTYTKVVKQPSLSSPFTQVPQCTSGANSVEIQ